MKTYPKINTIFQRDKTISAKKPPIILNTWSEPEFEFLQNNIWLGYEKLDGQNIRIQYHPERHQMFIKGKEDKAQFFAGVPEALNKIFNADMLSPVFPAKDRAYEVCLYGEVFGGSVAAEDKPHGEAYSEDILFRLFDVFIDKWWLNRNNIEDIAGKLNIGVTPPIFRGTLNEAIELVKHGFPSVINPNIKSEGMVLFPEVQLYNKKGERIITKLKTEDFARLQRLGLLK